MRQSSSLKKRWRRKRRRRLLIRFLFLTLILGAAAAGIWRLAKGKKEKTEPFPNITTELSTKSPAQPAPSPEEAFKTETPSAQSKKERKPEATPSPSPEKTPAVTAKPSVGTAVKEEYFDDAVFIGDSRTEGFGMFSGLKNATFYTGKGLKVDTIFTDTIKVNGKRMTILDALKKKKFGKIYIMLGVNELGWIYGDVFIEKYTELLDVIKKAQPDAIIYVESILHVSKKKSSEDKVYNNKKINERNKLLKKMAQKEAVYYLNVNEAVTGEDGALPPDASVDGVHLNAEYCKLWKEYLMAHAVKEE